MVKWPPAVYDPLRTTLYNRFGIGPTSHLQRHRLRAREFRSILFGVAQQHVYCEPVTCDHFLNYNAVTWPCHRESLLASTSTQPGLAEPTLAPPRQPCNAQPVHTTAGESARRMKQSAVSSILRQRRRMITEEAPPSQTKSANDVFVRTQVARHSGKSRFGIHKHSSERQRLTVLKDIPMTERKGQTSRFVVLVCFVLKQATLSMQCLATPGFGQRQTLLNGERRRLGETSSGTGSESEPVTNPTRLKAAATSSLVAG